MSKQGKFWEFLKKFQRYQYSFINQFKVKLIANVSTKLVLEEGADSEDSTIFDNKFCYFLKVVEKFEESSDEEEINNISGFFIDLIQSISQNP